MSDYSKYLPLSQRPRQDESGVTSNWAQHVGSILLQLGDIVERLDEAHWATVSAATAEVIHGVSSTRTQRLRERLTRTPAPALDRAASVAQLRTLARAALLPPATRHLHALAAAVVGGLDIARLAGAGIRIDPIATGAVALARSLSGPLEVRAVVQTHTLVAIDADWRVGLGPEIPATASVIVLFLYGRGPAPRP